jgi:hypothetical protein
LKSSLLAFNAVVTNFFNVEISMVGKVDATWCNEVGGGKTTAVMGGSGGDEWASVAATLRQAGRATKDTFTTNKSHSLFLEFI